MASPIRIWSWRPIALQDVGLLDHAREIRDCLFVDGRAAQVSRAAGFGPGRPNSGHRNAAIWQTKLPDQLNSVLTVLARWKLASGD